MQKTKLVAPLIFKYCVNAIKNNVLIKRVSRRDKEFHFQDWFKRILEQIKQAEGINYEQLGRNSYPDFVLVKYLEGYEVKGLAYPGRELNFDANSQIPKGYYNERTIFYVFGRYPKNPDGDEYPVLDLVICHGNFLNADNSYEHENKHVKGFGSYGDILIRDRKMYVVPTPFGLLEGVAHHRTLILPEGEDPGEDFFQVGKIERIEAKELLVAYTFDLKKNEIYPKRVPNPNAGKSHIFYAWRLKGEPKNRVNLRDKRVLE